MTTGTGGNAPECTKPEDCGLPANACVTNTCDAGKCGTAPVAIGTVVAGQTAGDCKSKQCDGKGAVGDVTDDTDVPNDSKACTDDACAAGVPSNKNSAAGTACGANLTCDGNGACTGCASASDCPAAANECQTPTCTASVCGFSSAPAGTVVAAQTVGDCKSQQCDGSGAVVAMPDNNDKPVDNKACTDDVCTAGVPTNPNTMAGGVCAEGTGTLCSGNGGCVQCLSNANCPGGACSDNFCSPLNGCDASTATDLTGGAPTTVTFANGNFSYAPRCIKVTQGTVVTFNGSFANHPLLGGIVAGGVATPAASGPFVPVTNAGTTKDFTMTATGTFPYYCTAHVAQNMDGVVFVVP